MSQDWVSTPKLPIYLDYHSTTPVDPLVLEAMLPYMCENFGNYSSGSHEFGWKAQAAVDRAREQLAAWIGAQDPSEIIFTSGATEANNLAILGLAQAHWQNGQNHIITNQAEHLAVLGPCEALKKKGFELTVLPVDSEGRIDPKAVQEALRPTTLLVSVMAANNEVGTIQPTGDIGQICRKNGVFFHVDAAQAAGRLPIDVEKWKADLLSLSGHKVYGPKGVGLLYKRRKNPRARLEPVLYGGGHELGLRPGTLNVSGIIGFAKAAELAHASLSEDLDRFTEYQTQLWKLIQQGLPDVHLNGPALDSGRRLANNLNISIQGVESASLMMAVREIAFSTGSACASGSYRPSHVLQSMGLSEDRIRSSFRIGLGRATCQNEIQYVARRFIEAAQELRELSPLYVSESASTHQGVQSD